MGLTSRERRQNLLKGGKANEHLLVCAPSGLGLATANQYREGTQWVPAPVIKGLRGGLSRTKGNFQVRFLGEGVAVMPLPYPTRVVESLLRTTPALRATPPYPRRGIKPGGGGRLV